MAAKIITSTLNLSSHQVFAMCGAGTLGLVKSAPAQSSFTLYPIIHSLFSPKRDFVELQVGEGICFAARVISIALCLYKEKMSVMEGNTPM